MFQLSNKIYTTGIKSLVGAGILFFVASAYHIYTTNLPASINKDLGKFIDKRDFYEQAVYNDSHPEHTIAWYQLGRMDFLEGKFVSALDKFNKQVAYFGDTIPNVYYMIGLTYGYSARESGRSEEWELAEKNFRKAVEYFPDQPWPKVDLAWILFSQGKYAEILPITSQGLNDHPDNPWLLNMQGLALLNSADEQNEAYQFFVQAREEAEKLTPTDWGIAYPGNDPASWPVGLAEMKNAIDKNIEIARPLHKNLNESSEE